MTNAEMAIDLVVNYFEANHIMVGTSEIREIVNRLEEKFDPIDFISLAALAISNPNKFEFTISEIREIRNYYFP